MRASVVVRTLDEERHLPELLAAIEGQDVGDLEVEVIVVDSGSTDRTLEIAALHGCRIGHIRREEFSWGRSLNRGCETATGEWLVFVSGHCVPVGPHWLRELVAPLRDGRCGYVYGRQVGGAASRFSECRLFARQYPAESRIPQEGFFCNNANAALRRDLWAKHRFDEDLTGLEDMHLARALVESRVAVGYAASACVVHHHDETWAQVRRRFEREAYALQHILPNVHMSALDFPRYFASAVLHDARDALGEGALLGRLGEIVRFRFAQYLGSYRGNHEHRALSRLQKEEYFYPTRRDRAGAKRVEGGP